MDDHGLSSFSLSEMAFFWGLPKKIIQIHDTLGNGVAMPSDESKLASFIPISLVFG